MVADGECQKECYNKRCNFDGGDCIKAKCSENCFVSWLGDGQCDFDCNTPGCEWDKGDCLMEGYCAPECEDKTMLNNGVCNPEC
jgi:hypothetical protein